MGKDSMYTAHVDASTTINIDGQLKSQLEEANREIKQLTQDLVNMSNALERSENKVRSLEDELSDFKSGRGIEVLEDKLKGFEETAERSLYEFRAFLESVNLNDAWGNNDFQFEYLFDQIKEGSMTAGQAIMDVKAKFDYLMEDNYRNSGGAFDSQMVQSLLSSFRELFDVVSSVSEKIDTMNREGVRTIGEVGGGAGTEGAAGLRQLNIAIEEITASAGESVEPLTNLIRSINELTSADDTKILGVANAFRNIAAIGQGTFSTQKVDNIIQLANRLNSLNADKISGIHFDFTGLNDLHISKASLKNLAEFLPQIASIDASKLEAISKISFTNFNDIDVKRGGLSAISLFSEKVSELIDKIRAMKAELSGEPIPVATTTDQPTDNSMGIAQEAENIKDLTERYREHTAAVLEAVAAETQKEEVANLLAKALDFEAQQARMTDEAYQAEADAYLAELELAEASNQTTTALQQQIDTLTGVNRETKSAEESFQVFIQAEKEEAAAAKETAKAEQAAEREAKKENTALQAVHTSLQQGETIVNKYIGAQTSMSASSREAFDNLRKAVSNLRNAEEAYRRGEISLDELTNANKEYKLALKTASDSLKTSGRSFDTFSDKVKKLTSRFGGLLSATRVVMAVVRELKKMVQASIEIDTAMTQMQIVTRESDAVMKQFGDTAAEVAKKTSASMKDVIDSATVFARLGYSLNDSAMLSQYTTMLQNVGDIDVSSAQNAITAIVKAFDIGVDDIEAVMDKLVTTGNNFPISVSQIAEGMNNAASVLASTGNSFEQSVALLTAANTTVQNASKASTGLRTLAARITKTGTELNELGEAMTDSDYDALVKALTDANVALTKANGEFRSTYDIMSDIAAQWDNLTNTERNALAQTLSGTRQQAIFYSIVEQFQEASGAMDAMADSAGALDSAYSVYLDSVTAHTDRFKATFQELSMNIFGSDLVAKIVDIGTSLLNVVNTLQKIGLLLPAIASTLVLIKGISLAQQITKVSSGLIMQKQVTDTLTLSIAGLTEGQKRLIVRQLEAAVAAHKLTDTEKQAIIEQLALTTSTGGLTGAVKGLAGGFKTLMASIPVWGWIALGITVLIDAIGIVGSAAGNAKDKIAELDDELSQITGDAQSAAKSFTDLKNSFDGIYPRFIELASGVDEFGRNISLTDEEYTEFLKLNNQVAEMFPSIDAGVDSNGNHMLSLSYSVDSLTESLNALVEKERELANETVAEKVADTLDNIKDASRAYDRETEKLQRKAGILEETITSGLKMRSMPGANIEVIDENLKQDQRLLDEYDRKVAVILEKRKARYKKINPIMSAWMQTTDDYASASDDVQNILKKVFGNIDYSVIDPKNMKNEGKLKSYISSVFIEPLIEAEPDVQDAISGLFDIKSAFESGKINYGEFSIVNPILSALDEAGGLSTELSDAINKMLGIDEINSGIETIRTSLQNGAKEYSDAIKDYQGILNEAKSLEIDLSETVFGNIDTNRRQVLEWTEETITKFSDALKSYGQDAEELKGSISTVFGGVGEYDGVDIAFTPILQTGNGPVLLSQDTVDKYIFSLIDKASEESGAWKGKDLIRLDTEGLEVDGQIVSGIIADIGDTAQRTSEIMHYLGEDGAVKGSYKELEKLAAKAGLTVDEFIKKYGNVKTAFNEIETYIQGLSHEEAKIAIKIVQSDSSITLDELQEQMRQLRYEAAEWTAPLDFSKFASGMESVAGGIDKVVSAMEKLKEGTQLTGKEMLDLIDKYPQLLEQADIFANGSVEAQKNALNAILDMKEQEYDKSIDVKIAELEATQKVIENQLSLEEKKANVIGEIEVGIANGEIDTKEELVDKVKELNDLQGQNYVRMENGILKVNEEALKDQLDNGQDFGKEATDNIWKPYSEVIATSNKKGLSAALEATSSFLKKLWNKVKSAVSALGQTVANAWKDMFSGNWKGIGSYFSSFSEAVSGDNSVSVGPLVVEWSGKESKLNGQSIDDWISDQQAATVERIKQLDQIKVDTQTAIDNLRDLKGLELGDIYKSTSKSSSGSSSGKKSSSSDKEDTWFDLAYKLHKHYLEMDAESMEDYLAWLDGAYQQAYAEGILKLDDFYKYQEEVYKGLRDLFKDYLSDTEHQISMLQFNGADNQQIISIYQRLISSVESEISKAYARGLDNNDDYIQELQKKWQSYTDAIRDLFKDTMSDIEHEISMRKEFKGETRRIVSLYKQMIASIENEIRAARARGLTDSDDYIQELQKQWISCKNSIEEMEQELKDNAKSAIEKLVDIRKDMLKQSVEDEKDSLKKRLDLLKDFYQKQKEMLQDSLDDEKYKEEQNEKRKAVIDIKTQIDQLKYDNSAWAQKKRLELEQELHDKQKELDDFERDHAVETAQDELDRISQAEEENYNKRLEDLDTSLGTAKDLYERALNDIRSGSVQLYNEMIEYNNEYGDGIRETITNSWEEAYAALKEYKEYYGTLYDGIDLANATGYSAPESWDSAPVSGPSNHTASSPSPTPAPKSNPSTPSGTSNNSSGSTSQEKVSLDYATKRKIAAAVWNGRLGWGSNPERAKRLTEVFGPDNGIQALVNANVGKNDPPPGDAYSYLSMRKKYRGYWTGTHKATAGLHPIDEYGAETIFESMDGNKYKMFSGREMVLNAGASDFLYKFATSGGDFISNMIGDILNRGISKINTPITNNEINMGDIIINGNAERATISEIRRSQRDAVETMLKELNRLNRQ